jgi:hypothetical protein
MQGIVGELYSSPPHARNRLWTRDVDGGQPRATSTTQQRRRVSPRSWSSSRPCIGMQVFCVLLNLCCRFVGCVLVCTCRFSFSRVVLV